jgi:glycosyltransferase involved in cell wall biosynthesis
VKPNFLSSASSEPPKVSVLMLAYNQERFIAQAIESVLRQVTDFPFEVVIGEDCSTDRTREIIARFQQAHPRQIRLLCGERNLGMTRNEARTLRACRGEYVALLEGDDFWTAADKLQRQADHLDRHPECSFCFHEVEVICDEEGPPPEMLVPRGPILQMEQLMFENPVQTCSAMFRRRLFPESPEWFLDLGMSDWPLFILLNDQGEGHLLEGKPAAYRIHGGGVWSRSCRKRQLQSVLHMLDCLERHFTGKYRTLLRRSRAETHACLAVHHEMEGDTATALKCSSRAVLSAPSMGHLRHAARLMVKAGLPKTYHWLRRRLQRI